MIELSGCIIIERGELLLLFRSKHHHYEFPGGKVERGESLEDAALRETQEELGISVELAAYAGHAVFNIDGINYKSHKYFARITGAQSPRVVERDKFHHLLWIPLEYYKSYKLAPNAHEFCEAYAKRATPAVITRKYN